MQTNNTNNHPPAQGGLSNSDPLRFQPVFAHYEKILPTEVYCPGCSHRVLRAFKKRKPNALLPTSVYGCECTYLSAGEVREPIRQEDWERDVGKLVDDGGSLPQPAAEPAAAGPDVSNPLSDSERDRLTELERIVDEGLQTFVEVGSALSEIRDSKLYRQTHSTFETYCRERWAITRNYANKLISAAEVASNLSTIVPKPASESQVRPLAKLEPEQQTKAWQAAVKDSPNGTGDCKASRKRQTQGEPGKQANIKTLPAMHAEKASVSHESREQQSTRQMPPVRLGA